MPYNTPGVYVEEVSTLPPSVASVATAIPAFIGCTQRGGPATATSAPVVKRIDTLLDYESYFGKAPDSQFTATTTEESGVTKIAVSRTAPTPYEFVLYHSLSLYFANGGGSCYVISVGNYADTPTIKQFEDGLAALAKEDEPTLIVLTDAVNLGLTNYYALCAKALKQCGTLQDRFTIIDVVAPSPTTPVTNPPETAAAALRAAIRGSPTDYPMYGAAYYPNLLTVLTYQPADTHVTVNPSTKAVASGGSGQQTPPVPTWEMAFGGIVINQTGSSAAPKAKTQGGKGEVAFVIDPDDTLTVSGLTGKKGPEVETKWNEWAKANDAKGFRITAGGDEDTAIELKGAIALESKVASLQVGNQSADSNDGQTLADLKTEHTARYNQIKAALAQDLAMRVILPPSPAIAGVYASVDRNRGVWKAPANVSLNSVIGPVVKITHDEQGLLNVDATSGKSINAIRAFTGKGTLVWGARTLAGNDNEWRYIPVRRLFITMEESIRKATSFAVFEPNDASTWLKVKAMIESYLYGLWQQGALAGPKPEAAYFVHVGLGQTMTTQDVLEGRMIVKVGVAAVRPAEFIILQFTHKLQEA